MLSSNLTLLLVAALVVILLLSAKLVHLYLEVWANRRVIQALERAGVKPEKKSKSPVPELLAWSLLLMVFFQILVQLLG